MKKLIFSITFIISCCGYSTKILLPSNIKTIAIPVVNNLTIKPGLAELLTEQLITDFTKDRTLQIAQLDKADLILECKITNYEKTPQSYTADQEVTEWKITLTAEIMVENKTSAEPEILIKENVSVWIIYDASKEEDEGIQQAISKLSQEIIRKVTTSW
ncbi:MAG: LptE family protein [candidate division WOR-3 bacterium]